MACDRAGTVAARCFALSALAVLTASAAACRNFHSGPHAATGGAGPVDAGGSGGTGGAATSGGTGATGGTGLADAGAPGGNGGAVDSGFSTDAADEAARLLADQACRAAIDTSCRRVELCFGVGCLKAEPYAPYPCPDYYFNDASERTVANITACLGDIERQPCSDVVLVGRPACFATGKRAGGEGCAYSSQCRSGRCNGANGVCGTCAPTANPGQACGTDVGYCPPGQFCHRMTQTCTPASSIVHAAEGQPCDLSASPVLGCEGDLLCEIPAGGATAGTCRRIPAAGQPCAQIGGGLSPVCGPGARCSSGLCVLLQACGDATCGVDWYCRFSDFTCVPDAAEGEVCGNSAMGSTSRCREQMVCDTSTWTCRRPRGNGESCDAVNRCSGFLRCTEGTCRGIGSASCPAMYVDAGAADQ